MNKRENHSTGAEARRAVPKHHWSPARREGRTCLLRYLGAVATVSASQPHGGTCRHAARESGSGAHARFRPEGGSGGRRHPWGEAAQAAPQVGPPLVRDVMDVPATSMQDDLSCRETARLLAREHVGALPVVDADDWVVGVVSESDLLAKIAFEASGHRPGPLGRMRGAAPVR
ncbi:CBS domain-containing protein [Streptomyces sp. NPDC046931]|uniref:CBS domain-containing protein n=1 Tax=Streptomyces sp. NPDC046931 TaxID=3154806 RepID=UPI0033C4176E